MFPVTEANMSIREMTEEAKGAAEDAKQAAEDGTIRENAGNIASKVGSKAQGVAAKGQDIGMDKAGEGLENVAHRMRDRASGDGVKSAATTKAADGIEKTAGYLKEHDATEFWADVSALVRSHPLKALFGALIAGYFIGKALRK